MLNNQKKLARMNEALGGLDGTQDRSMFKTAMLSVLSCRVPDKDWDDALGIARDVMVELTEEGVAG